jgi:hypothetical protein
MTYFAICNPLRKNVWYIGRNGVGGVLYVIATTTEHHAKELAAAMNSYPVSTEIVELSEHADPRVNPRKSWADRTNQRKAG